MITQCGQKKEKEAWKHAMKATRTSESLTLLAVFGLSAVSDSACTAHDCSARWTPSVISASVLLCQKWITDSNCKKWKPQKIILQYWRFKALIFKCVLTPWARTSLEANKWEASNSHISFVVKTWRRQNKPLMEEQGHVLMSASFSRVHTMDH